MLTSRTLSRRSAQSGSTLVVAMMLVILIMMMGISAMVSSDTQFKLSGNLQYEETALNNAERAVNTAEQWLVVNYLDGGFDTYSNAKPEVHPIGHMASSNPLTMTWSDSNSTTVTAGDESQRYYIELISKNVQLQGSDVSMGGVASSGCNKANTYLITARGTSARGTYKYVQSYYSVRLKNGINCK